MNKKETKKQGQVKGESFKELRKDFARWTEDVNQAKSLKELKARLLPLLRVFNNSLFSAMDSLLEENNKYRQKLVDHMHKIVIEDLNKESRRIEECFKDLDERLEKLQAVGFMNCIFDWDTGAKKSVSPDLVRMVAEFHSFDYDQMVKDLAQRGGEVATAHPEA